MNDLRHSSDYGGMGSVRDSNGNRIGIGNGYNPVLASLTHSDFNQNGYNSSIGTSTGTSISASTGSAGHSNSQSNSHSFMKDFQGQAISDMTNGNGNGSSGAGTWQYEYFNNLNLNGTNNLSDRDHRAPTSSLQDEPTSNASSNTAGSSSNANVNSSMNTKSVPVKYTIYWDKRSSAFTLTLRIPVPVDPHHNATRDSSPFQKVVSNGQQPPKNDQGRPMETHALRIPMAHILSLSSQTKSTNNHQDPTPWLDKTILRSRINDGGKAIGLVQTYSFQTMAAVEETAIQLPQWCPRSTEAINVEIHLSEGIVTLLANVCSEDSTTAAGSGTNTNVQANSNAVSTSSSSNNNHSSNPSLQKYNVLNESSGELLATAPSFPPPGQHSSSSSSSNSLHLNDNNNIQSNSYNNNSNGIFNAPTWNGAGVGVGGSPFATSWGSSFPGGGGGSGGGGNNGNNILGQQQHLSNMIPSSSSSTQFSDRNMFSNLFSNNNIIGQGMNMNNMDSNAAGTNPSSNVGAGAGAGAAGTIPSSYFDNTLSTRQVDSNNNILSQEHTSRPDPSIIIGPLLNMGFNKEECEAAANAIRNISMNGHSLTTQTENDSLKDTDYNQLHNHNQNNHHDRNVENISKSLQSRDSRSYSTSSSQQNESEDNASNVMTNNMIQGTSAEEVHSNITSNSVWGNAGKMKIIKIPSVVVDGTSESDEVTIDSDEKVSTMNTTTTTTTTASTQSRQKMVKVLDIPPELNAFVFHCNAQTRDECLSRGLFG